MCGTSCTSPILAWFRWSSAKGYETGSRNDGKVEENDADPARLASSLRAELRPGHPGGDPGRTSALIALRSSRPAPGHERGARSASNRNRQTAILTGLGHPRLSRTTNVSD